MTASSAQSCSPLKFASVMEISITSCALTTSLAISHWFILSSIWIHTMKSLKKCKLHTIPWGLQQGRLLLSCHKSWGNSSYFDSHCNGQLLLWGDYLQLRGLPGQSYSCDAETSVVCQVCGSMENLLLTCLTQLETITASSASKSRPDRSSSFAVLSSWIGSQ